MENDLIGRSDLLNAKPEFMNEKVVRDTKYQTTKDRIYAKAWNDCNDCWIDTIENAQTVETPTIYEFKGCDNCELERPHGEWITYDVDITPHPLHCKNCGWSNHHIKNEYIKEFKVCPDCGAKMKGGKDE